jgi:hypothetical protein
LSDTLKQQGEHWPAAYAVIMLADPVVSNGRFHQDYIRVLPVKAAGKLVDPYYNEAYQDESFRMQCLWDTLTQLQDVFRYFHQGKGNERRGGQGQQNAASSPPRSET